MSFLLKTKYILRGSTKSYNLVKLTWDSCFSLNYVNSRSLSDVAEMDDSFTALDRKFERADEIYLKSNRIPQPLLKNLHDLSKSKKSITSFQSLLLIRSCLSLVASPEVKGNFIDGIWETLLEIDSQIDISHFNAALHGLLETNRKFSTTDFLQEMNKRDIEPNRVTYSCLIHKACLEGNLTEANMLLEKIKDDDILITQGIFNSMIIGNSRANNIDGCLDIVNIMKQKGLEPDKGTYVALGQSYIEHGKLEEFESLIDEIVSKNVLFDLGSLTSLIVVLARKNALGLINKVTERIEMHSGFHVGMVQCILQLIDENYHDAAYEVLKFKERASSHADITFFIRNIAEKDGSFNEVMKFCRKIEEDMDEKFIFASALRFYIDAGNIENAVATLKIMHENGTQIRQIYFYPLLAAAPKEDMLLRLNELVHLGLRGTSVLCEYIFPKLEPISSPVNVYYALIREGLSKQVVIGGLIHYYLRKDDLNTAGFLARKFPIGIAASYKMIADTYISQRLASSTVAILRLFVHSLLSEGTPDKEDQEAFIYLGKSLAVIISSIDEDHQMSEILTPLFLEMANSGVGIPKSFHTTLCNMIGSGMTPELESALEGVINAPFISNKEFSDSSSPPLSNKDQVIQYLRDGKVEEAKKIYEKSDKAKFLEGVYSRIFTDQDDFATLKEIMDGIKQHNFPINRISALKYATLCAKDGKFQEAADSILTHTIEDDMRIFGILNKDEKYCERMHTSLCDCLLQEEDINNFNLIQESFLKRNYLSQQVVYSQYILHHLKKNDLEAAFNAFAKLYERNINPYVLKQLMKSCIAVKDTDKLQKITNLLSRTMRFGGRSYALLLLAYANLYMGEDSTASSILKSEGLKDESRSTFRECRHLLQNGLFVQAEKLVAYSSAVSGIDRDELYLMLLDHHVDNEDPERALNLWESMQEENTAASRTFLFILGTFLQRKGLAVPFAIPTKPHNHRPQTNSKQVTNMPVRRSPGSFSVQEIKTKISNLLQLNELDEATNLARDLLSKGLTNIDQLDRLCPILSNLGRTEDLKSLRKLSSFKSEQFSGLLARSYLIQNKMEEYLENMNELMHEFDIVPHFTSIKNALEKFPELESKILDCVKLIPKAHQYILWSVLWDQKFWIGETEKAEEIYQEHIKDGHFMVSCGDLKDEKKFEKIDEIISIVNRKPELRMQSLSFLYSQYAAALASFGRFDKICKLLNDSPNVFVMQTQLHYIRKMAAKHNYPLNITRFQKKVGRR